MAINSRIAKKVKELVPDDQFMRNKLIIILNRADEGKHLSNEIKNLMSEIKA